MKRFILCFAIIAFVGLSFSQGAEEKAPFPVQKKENVCEVLKDEIEMPEFAIKDKLKGEVWISFKIDNNGKINVLQTNYMNKKFNDYLIDELDELCFIPSEDVVNQKINMKFSFKVL